MTLTYPKIPARLWVAIAAILFAATPAFAQPKPDVNEATEEGNEGRLREGRARPL